MRRMLYKHFLNEDAPTGDITTAAIFSKSKKTCCAKFITREDIVVAGFAAVCGFLKANFGRLKLVVMCDDGMRAKAGDVLATVSGPVAAILTAERTCLNLLQHLSGIATQTAQFVLFAKQAGGRAQIFDTRKTIPGFRVCQKQAVRAGGGFNHRRGLSDQYLIKDNHIDVAGSVTRAVQAVLGHKKHYHQRAKIQVEVRSLAELREALILPVDIILLDNMTVTQIKRAVVLRDRCAAKQKPLLEISGGVTLKNIKRLARLGVERISVGALTHSVQAVDIAMKIASGRVELHKAIKKS